MKILNFIYTLYFNFRYLPLNQALHLPIWVTTNLRECKLHKNQIIIMPPVKCKQVLIGGGVKVLDYKPTRLEF